MTRSRLTFIVLIFAGATIAWMILGASIASRTATSSQQLRQEVAGLWGGELTQTSPTLSITEILTEEQRKRDKKPREAVVLSPDSSDIRVDLGLDLRRKGLLWYRTYEVEFDASYTVANPLDNNGKLTTKLFLPTSNTIYDDFLFSVNDLEAAPGGGEPPEARQTVTLAGGESATIKVHYRSRGMNTWRYSFGSDVLAVKNFKLVAQTDFDRIDFPAKTLSPDPKRHLDPGWELTWEFKQLISGLQIGVEMPEKLNPGPWAARLSRFAPIGLLFYMFVLVIVGVMRDENLHPMHYFLVAGGFFSFHLLLAYTVHHIDAHLAFTICSIVSVLLVVPYLMRVVTPGYGLKIALPAQLAFLVLFSWAFYFPGYTGLTITIASILTLGLIMHLTAKVKWEDKLKGVAPSAKPPIPPAPSGAAEQESGQVT